jgi:flagellar basal-body rod modification protein FlgD
MSTSVSTISSLLATDSSSSTKSSTSTSGLDVDDFLTLLVSQMQNQDPLSSDSSSGSSGTDYISQLAQFTMLQQLTNLNSEFSASKAYSLIGKYVYLNDGTSSETTIGKVDGVVQNDGDYSLVVNGKEYDLSDVSAVVNDTSDVDSTILNSADLIGKQVTATVTDDTTDETTTVTGVVEKVTIDDGLAYVTINGQSIPLSSVTEITAASTSDSSTTTDDTTQNA